MGVSARGSSPDPDICNIDMRVICANIKITDIREPVKKSVENSTLGGGRTGSLSTLFSQVRP